VRHGVRLALVVCVGLGLGIGVLGCQPLYGAKPDKLPTPQKKKAPKEEVVTEVPVKEIDECTADFRGDSKRVNPQPRVSGPLIEQANEGVAAADKLQDPMAAALKVKDAIDKYRNALIKDPYNTEATLKLALAYDRLYRKGCAILLLKRLASLSAHPDFARQANSAIDSISDNGQWFRRYRKDAMTAVGR